MDKAVEAVKREFSTVRTGKATTALLDLVRVEAYGNEMPLTQVASVAAPEPKLLTVQPWDKGLLKAVEKGILASDLGLTPSNDGNIIRIPIPPLTEERRKELVKVVHKFAEEGRVAIRHARTETMNRIKKPSTSPPTTRSTPRRKCRDARRSSQGGRRGGEGQRSGDHGSLMLSGPIPRHVAIIMDGNGRWANEAPAAAAVRPSGRHEGRARGGRRGDRRRRRGADAVRVSDENWNRPATEISALMICSRNTSPTRSPS